MLDLILDILEPVADYFVIYKRNKAAFLEGVKLEGISMLFLIAAAACGFIWNLWLPAGALTAGALWFGFKFFRHIQKCLLLCYMHSL